MRAFLEYKQLIYVGFARSAPSTNSVVKIRGNESLINFQKRANITEKLIKFSKSLFYFYLLILNK